MEDELRNKLSQFKDKNIFLGFRPSAVKLNTGAGVEGQVIVTETLGEDTYLRLNFGPAIEITVKAEGVDNYRPGDSVSVEVDKNKIYFFDSQGNRI